MDCDVCNTKINKDSKKFNEQYKIFPVSFCSFCLSNLLIEMNVNKLDFKD